MTLAEILSNESLRLREFPVAADKVFWSHAGVTALPRCVVDAMKEYLDACTHADQESALPAGSVLETRKLAAQLLGCTPQEIALLGPTTFGLNLICNGLDWQRGDNVVFYQDDYPANVYPWQALETKGVELRRIQTARLGEITVDQITPLLDKRTRLVALASVHFLSGYRIDVDAIGKQLRERGVLFSLDSIQSLGALPTKMTHVDFSAADSHKWLLGPQTSGILHVRREVQDRLRPTLLGADNIPSPNFIAQESIRFPTHAGRYEPSALNFAGILGLRAALKLLLDIGIENIETRLLSFGDTVIAAMEKKRFRFLGSRERNHRSGILTFTKPGANLAELHARLRQRNIIVSLRAMRDGTPLLRLSPHFYNTGSELDRLTAEIQ